MTNTKLQTNSNHETTITKHILPVISTEVYSRSGEIPFSRNKGIPPLAITLGRNDKNV